MNKRIVIVFVLLIFCTGMLMGSVAASHTYHKGKYTFTVSDSQYKKIQDVKNGKSDSIDLYIKTKHKKTVKIPKYKNKKVTKKKWVYKNIVTDTDYYNKYGKFLKTSHSNKIQKYFDNGWKYHSSFSKTYKYGVDGHKIKYFSKVKKKVKYTATVKVKNGYKKVKAPVYASVYPAEVNGKTVVEVCFMVEYGDYFDFISSYYRL